MVDPRNASSGVFSGCFFNFVCLCTALLVGGLFCLALLVSAFQALTDERGVKEVILEHIALSEDGASTILKTKDGESLTYKGVYQLPTGSRMEVHWRQHLWSDVQWISRTTGEDSFTAKEVEHFDEPKVTIVQASDGRSFRYVGIASIPVGKPVKVLWTASSGDAPQVTFVQH
jgi:hypothetical protein